MFSKCEVVVLVVIGMCGVFLVIEVYEMLVVIGVCVGFVVIEAYEMLVRLECLGYLHLLKYMKCWW